MVYIVVYSYYYLLSYTYTLYYILLFQYSFPFLSSHLSSLLLFFLIPHPVLGLTPHVLSEWMVEVCAGDMCGIRVGELVDVYLFDKCIGEVYKNHASLSSRGVLVFRVGC